MQKVALIISPLTRISELLECYPELEEVLITISPLFSNLRNPVLRRTIARVATLQHAAVIGDVSVEDMVARLRKEVGQTDESIIDTSPVADSVAQPDWMKKVKVSAEYDASIMINQGESPLSTILELAKDLKSGTALLLITPFTPAPIIDKLHQMGFLTWVSKSDSACRTYIYAP